MLVKIREQFKVLFSKKNRKQMTAKNLQEEMRQVIKSSFKQFGERIKQEQDEKKKFQILDEFLLMKQEED